MPHSSRSRSGPIVGAGRHAETLPIPRCGPRRARLSLDMLNTVSSLFTIRSKTTQASAVGLPPFRRVAFEPRLARVREPRGHPEGVQPLT